MALTREQKKGRVSEATDVVGSAASVVFMTYDGLNVSDVEALRGELHEAGARMRVVPKRLLKRALDEAKIEFDPTAHEGQFAFVWGDDPVTPAKILHTFAKGREGVTLAAAVLDKSLLSAEEVTALAQLPGRQELLGQLVSVMAGPLRGFASVLQGVPRNTVYVLQAIADQKSAA